MSELPLDVAKLLESERERSGPPADVSARLQARLAASIAALPPVPDGGGGGGDGGASGAGNVGGGGVASGGLGSSMMRSIAIGATTLGVGLGAGVAIDRAVIGKPEPRVVYVDRVVAASASAAETSEVPSLRPDDLPRAAGAPPAISAAPATTAMANRDYDLANERALLEAARTALGRSEAASALASLERHRARYPAGQLREEREALSVQALVSLGRTDEARARAERFKKDFPKSLFLPVVDVAK